MGNIPACVSAGSTYDLGPVVMTSQFACDAWAVPHFIIPFMMTIWTRFWFFGAFMAGFGEQLEYLTLWGLGSFVIFLGGTNGKDFNHDVENLAGSYIDDTIWMGYLGVFLGWVFVNYFVYPGLVRYRDVWNGRILHVLFYGFFLVFFITAIPASTHGVVVNGFPLGRLLYPIVHGITILLVVWLQPKDTWKGYTKRQQVEFWLAMWSVSLIYNVQNVWDWFYSSHFQVSLVTGIILFIALIASVVKWRWYQRMQLDFTFEWSGPRITSQ
jgi:hypothetical protein